MECGHLRVRATRRRLGRLRLTVAARARQAGRHAMGRWHVPPATGIHGGLPQQGADGQVCHKALPPERVRRRVHLPRHIAEPVVTHLRYLRYPHVDTIAALRSQPKQPSQLRGRTPLSGALAPPPPGVGSASLTPQARPSRRKTAGNTSARSKRSWSRAGRLRPEKRHENCRLYRAWWRIRRGLGFGPALDGPQGWPSTGGSSCASRQQQHQLTCVQSSLTPRLRPLGIYNCSDSHQK